jgi:hypothetical protein
LEVIGTSPKIRDGQYILKDKVKYKELGVEYLESRRKQKTADRYIKKLTEMGYRVELKEAI